MWEENRLTLYSVENYGDIQPAPCGSLGLKLGAIALCAVPVATGGLDPFDGPWQDGEMPLTSILRGVPLAVHKQNQETYLGCDEAS